MLNLGCALGEPLSREANRRHTRFGEMGVAVSSMFVGFIFGCVVLWSGGAEQQLEVQEPATNMALQPGAVAASRFSPFLAMPSFRSPTSRLPMRLPEFRTPLDVSAYATKMQVPQAPAPQAPRNMQNRPRQHQGAESSYVDAVEEEQMRKAEEATAAKDYFEAAQAREEAGPQKAPFPVNIFVHSDKSHQYGAEGEDYKPGTPKFIYLENKIAAALEKTHKQIRSVDVRLHVEGHKPKQYRMETTVKFDKPHKEGAVIVSKSTHSQPSFPEAVDHMHDTLKRQMVKEKEKHLSKLKHARKDADRNTADEEAKPALGEELYEDGMSPFD